MLDKHLELDLPQPQQCDYCNHWTDPSSGDEYISSYDPNVVFCSVRCAERWEQTKAQTARGDFGVDESMMNYCSACGGIHE